MQFREEDKIKATIFYHLRRKKVIGNVHTHYDTLKKGFPSHSGKNVEKVVKNLIREGFIITKPTSYGLQVSLNRKRVIEIEDFIKKIFGFEFD